MSEEVVINVDLQLYGKWGGTSVYHHFVQHVILRNRFRLRLQKGPTFVDLFLFIVGLKGGLNPHSPVEGIFAEGVLRVKYFLEYFLADFKFKVAQIPQ